MSRKFATDRTDRKFPLYWVTEAPPLPKQLSSAVLFANREGLISHDDLFDRTDDWMADAARIDRVLEERGAWDAYRQMLMQHAFPSRCPFWCRGDHNEVGIGGVHAEPICHELPVADFPRPGYNVQTVIFAWQDEKGVGEVQIMEAGLTDDDELTGDELVAVAEGHLAAASLLEEIKHHGGNR